MGPWAAVISVSSFSSTSFYRRLDRVAFEHISRRLLPIVASRTALLDKLEERSGGREQAAKDQTASSSTAGSVTRSHASWEWSLSLQSELVRPLRLFTVVCQRWARPALEIRRARRKGRLVRNLPILPCTI